jgi:uncharacterized repeat protein (TIGR04138 family)
MSLDFRTSLARLRRKAPVAYSADCLNWVLQAVKQNSAQTQTDPCNAASDLANRLKREAERQFGELSPSVLSNWGLIDGKSLYQALVILETLGAVHLSESDTEPAFSNLGSFYSIES